MCVPSSCSRAEAVSVGICTQPNPAQAYPMGPGHRYEAAAAPLCWPTAPTPSPPCPVSNADSACAPAGSAGQPYRGPTTHALVFLCVVPCTAPCPQPLRYLLCICPCHRQPPKRPEAKLYSGTCKSVSCHTCVDIASQCNSQACTRPRPENAGPRLSL